MNFIEKLKDQLNNPRNSMGRGEEVAVDRRSINELIYHFEALDSDARAKHSHYGNATVEEILSNAIQAMLHKHGGNTDSLMMVLMHTLSPMIKENLEKKTINRREK